MPRRTRPGNNDACSICGKVVKYKSDVARHYLQHAPNVEDLKTRCPWPNCRYKTLQKSNVSTHMIRSHGRKKIYFCSADPTCTFSALDQQSVDRHRRVHNIEDETLSPAAPELPRLDTIPDVTEATSDSSPAVQSEGIAFDPNHQREFTNFDQDLVDIMQFASMPPTPPNPEPVPAPSNQQEYCQPLSWEDYYSINQCFAEMTNNGTVPSNAPNPQLASAVYQYGRQYAPRNNLASCSIPAWVQPSNNSAFYDAYYQYEQQQAQQQLPFLPGSNWEYIPENMPSSSSSSSSGASSFGDYPPDYGVLLDPFPTFLGDLPPNYGVPLEPFSTSLGDLPPNYGVPLKPFPTSLGDLPPNYGVPLEPCPTSPNYGVSREALPPSHPSNLDLNVPVQAAPVCQYDEPWNLGLRYYGDEIPGASNLDVGSAQCLQLGSF